MIKFTQTARCSVSVSVEDVADKLEDENTTDLRFLMRAIETILAHRKDGEAVKIPRTIDPSAKIRVIKAVRRACGMLLAEAKKAVELGLAVQPYDGQREFLIKMLSEAREIEDESGRVFFDEEKYAWFAELSDGREVHLGRWPHSLLKTGRDENRRAIIRASTPDEGDFIRFVE